ncbi:peptidase domain-containing ABC transporter [Photobacterium sp. TLY01]|uniref:peptidase domain-containing ABC transporter n=1 Tax=Photobacterium sp. TLY01 TaxID=2907534 RepID=UPI001F34C872|nr:peptidase domain-containing ABC transporter [Photobacterium sp. TLY01]UIP28076.1 peptidase domain-containing ABC transporter [Photobacterium sp. TLY01]
MSDQLSDVTNTNVSYDPQLSLLSYSGKKRVPMVMQAEVAECGLACLAMIASYHGFQINIPPLRQRMALDDSGMNLKQMMMLAGDLQLAGRALKCDLEEIDQLQLPCILHWDLQHFVVLTGVSKKAVTINDPAHGKRKFSIAEFSQHFTGIALELTPTAEFQKKDERAVMKMRQLWRKITGLKRSLATLLSLSLVYQCTALLSPYYMQWVIDSVLLSKDTALLLVLACGFTLLLIFQSGLSAFRSWLVLRLSSAMSLQMGANLFHHLLRLPLHYFEKRHVGDIVSRFGALSAIRETLTTGLVEAVIDGVMAVVVLVMMFLYSPLLATVVLGIVLFSFLIQLAFYYPNRRITEENIMAEAKEDTAFLESIRAIQTIKLFGQESNRQNLWLNHYAEVINTNIRLGKLSIAENTLNTVLLGIESILVIYFGALIVIDGNLTVGMLIAFIAYKGQFTSSMAGLIDHVLNFKLLSLHLERLSDITLQEKEPVGYSTPLPKSAFRGGIRLENISFRYADTSDAVLTDVCMEIAPGESVAIVGASGCGKTTLLKIILGLLKPTSGRIYLDGIDMNDIPLSEYRRYFGSVMQNDMLLSGTVTENITLFESNYDENRVRECCRMACIRDEIEALPMGYHALVGDMGNSFSGGQLQRLFLARALYQSPKILCLDESTSHLDKSNEHWINDNIKTLTMTRIMIAHRAETISTADRVIQLK